jgi:hypothetical protein
VAAEREDTTLDRAAFSDDACEAEVVESTSHCTVTHRLGRWLRLRFYLPSGTRLEASSSQVASIAEPWAGGVDLYIPIPPRRATVDVNAVGLWSGSHTLVLDPAQPKPLGFEERGPCPAGNDRAPR